MLCGLFVSKEVARLPYHAYWNAFEKYFGRPIQRGWYVPKNVCPTCHSAIMDWANGGRSHIAYESPVLWKEPTSRENCYFCTSSLRGARMPRRKQLQYGVQTFALPAVPYCAESHVPRGPLVEALFRRSDRSISGLDLTVAQDSSVSDPSYRPPESPNRQPVLITQGRLNDLVRDLRLPKELAELLASRLGQWNLLEAGARVSAFRSRNASLVKYFAEASKMCYCTNVDLLFDALGRQHNPDEWRLFIDSSVRSLKAVLLHNGNKLPSVPVAYSTRLKENRASFSALLGLIDYDSYKWRVVADLKVVAILAGLRPGNVKRSCFLCEWDRTGTNVDQYARKHWPLRTANEPGELSVESSALVPRDRILLPPLHIKLGLFSSFVRTLAKRNGAPDRIDYPPLQYLKHAFPHLSDAKIRNGVFVGPQIRKLLATDEEFVRSMSDLAERRAWWAFSDVCRKLLGKNKAPDYDTVVAEMLGAYDALGVRMSLKIHLLNSHLETLAGTVGAESLADVSDEQGERFHQDISAMEKRYAGISTTGMMADYCWMQCSDHSAGEYRRKRKRTRFEPKS